jgi:hypothetical protein
MRREQDEAGGQGATTVYVSDSEHDGFAIKLQLSARVKLMVTVYGVLLALSSLPLATC